MRRRNCRSYAPPRKKLTLQRLTLPEANGLVARLGGYLDRKADGPPRAESLGIGLRRLHDMTWGWPLNEKVKQKCV
jgi:hypothetical protein